MLLFYVIAVAALNLFVVHRLTSQSDSRLSDRLADAAQPTLHLPDPTGPQGDDDEDIDDAPTFAWRVATSGVATPLGTGAPRLPTRTWSDGVTSFSIAGTPFRFDAVRQGSGWLVAGESVAQLDRVRSALLGPETLFGLVLGLVVFGGSLAIGRRASAPLEEIHRRQVEFTADASHELRTPLSVIEAEVGLALSRPRSPEDYRRTLERVRGEGDRLRRIVEDLLWLARADNEGSVTSDETADVGAIVRACSARFQSVAAARSVSLRARIDEEGPYLIRSDPDLIDRLVGVLVDNACRYAGDGGEVNLSVSTAGGRVVLRADDSGPGIPEEQRAHVLDRFHRVNPEAGGTGLGLAIADAVVRTSDGTWTIGTAPEGGARMQVTWRKVPNRPDRRSPLPEMRPNGSGQRSGPSAASGHPRPVPARSGPLAPPPDRTVPPDS